MGVLQNSINAMLGSVSAGVSFSAMNIKRMKSANERSKKLAQAKITQNETMNERKKFIESVKNTPAFGGKWGDYLSPKALEQLADKQEETRSKK